MGTMVHILEDDTDLAQTYERALREHGFETRKFTRIADFSSASRRNPPDIGVLDLGLPDGDGLTLLREMLDAEVAPMIVVSGRGDLSDKVLGIELGADDYLVKPIEPRELVARVRGVLRRVERFRAASAGARRDIASFNGWRVDFAGFTLSDPEGATRPLSAADAQMLRAFLEAPGRVLTREQIMGSASDAEGFDRSIDVRVSRLRKKLGDDPRSPSLIRTVYGAGYVFTASVSWT